MGAGSVVEGDDLSGEVGRLCLKVAPEQINALEIGCVGLGTEAGEEWRLGWIVVDGFSRDGLIKVSSRLDPAVAEYQSVGRAYEEALSELEHLFPPSQQVSIHS